MNVSDETDLTTFEKLSNLTHIAWLPEDATLNLTPTGVMKRLSYANHLRHSWELLDTSNDPTTGSTTQTVRGLISVSNRATLPRRGVWIGGHRYLQFPSSLQTIPNSGHQLSRRRPRHGVSPVQWASSPMIIVPDSSAKQEHLVERISPLIASLNASNIYLSQRLITQTRELAGEK
jgi:hypothetical protein